MFANIRFSTSSSFSDSVVLVYKILGITLPSKMASSVTPNTNNDTPLSNGTQTSLAMDDGNEEDPIKILGTNINAMFLVLMGTLIIFMQAGFGFLEAGSIRAKNTTNILIKNFADLTFGNLEFRVSKED